ncbi:ABC-2 type transport system ATP-binding protein [Microbacterium resistens]|uniref:ABC-2 type transport system ATP-binding protein n=1 Tax=Microbacterium resistens TaxID=156977 RepID=A0ABU1SE94_9MICO|nr:ATP-binding cassette domain-containing protein [Microbacterium resistens]MDR6867921.1 ABC-2 type transport system ATP-binding protein [Microbacterium resistens]
MNGLQLAGISRSFGSNTVLQDVDLTVQRGEIVGFIGGNGAGKTTTMRLILGLLSPSQGSITWDGRPITAADRRNIGYMPEERGLYPQMSVRDQVVHFALLEGHSLARATVIVDDLIRSLGLSDRAESLVQDLSLGNQQRVQLAVSLVGNPALLVLDEPFSGLDPLAVETMAALIQEQADRGVGVLFSSHQIELVERISDRVCVLDRGRVVVSGPVSELQSTGTTQWRLTFSIPVNGRLLAELAVPGGIRTAIDPENPQAVLVTVGGDKQDIPDELLDVVRRTGGLLSIEQVRPSLTDILSQRFISSGKAPSDEAQESASKITAGGIR